MLQHSLELPGRCCRGVEVPWSCCRGVGVPWRCCSGVGVPWELMQQDWSPCPCLTLHWQPYILYPVGESIHYKVSITKGDKICSQIKRSKGNLSPVDLCFMKYGNSLGRPDRKAKRMVVSGHTKEVLSFNFLKTRRIDENTVCDSLHVVDRMQHMGCEGMQGVPGWAKHQGVQDHKHSHEVCSDSDFA